MKEKILFITNLLPYPLNDGGKIKTYNTLRLLNSLYDIDLICFVDEIGDLKYARDIKKVCVHVECVYKKIKHHQTPFVFIIEIIKSIFSKYPYVIFKYSSRLMKRRIAKKMRQHQYVKIYVDHLQLFQYVSLSRIRNRQKYVILDQHNVESEIMARRLIYTKNIFCKLFLKYEHFKLIRHEKNACTLGNLVLAITERDRIKFDALTKGKCNCCVAPFFIERRNGIRYNPARHQDKIMLFLGTMSWYQNEDGLLWFYENVFKKYGMKKVGWKLLIVGSNPGPNITRLKDKNIIEVTGYVEDIRPYFKNALTSIVPLRICGGMRIKILDLFSFGIPVISTSTGCEGIPVTNGKNIIIADEPQKFFEALELMANDKGLKERLTENAFHLLKNNYSFPVALQRYKELLK